MAQHIRSVKPLPPQNMSHPIRAPTWVSTRLIFEQKLETLDKCTNLSHIKQIHAQIIKQNRHQDLYIAPKLIKAFSTCHQMVLAIHVFKQVHDPNVYLYNTLIRAYVQNSQAKQAFGIFLEMQKNGVFADNFTYPALLKACSGKSWLPLVQLIHNQIEKFGFRGDIYVPNSLIDCYSKCGALGVDAAMKLFTVMEERDVVSWNSMISGLAKLGRLAEARRLFDEMPERDIFSWNTILDGYVKAGDMNEAFQLFEIMPERSVVSWSTMVLGYSKAGDMEMASTLFEAMPVQNLVTWTTIISGYAEKGLVKEANSFYNRMEGAGLRPDNATLISILGACAESGLLGLGKRVYDSIVRNRFNCSIAVSNSLINMYAKCGSLDEALSIFNGMANRDLVSWNSMLHGLAVHGHCEKALQLFSRMKQEGVQPDRATFIGVLCACTHAGFVDKGLEYFYSMERDYGIVPQVEHYGCTIDLLGRGGRLRDAFQLVQSMPFEPNAIIWGSLLGACRMHNAVKMAEEVLHHLTELEPSDPGNYSMLSNILAAAGDWDGVAKVRQRMKSVGVEKPSGASSIEVDDEFHEFTVLDKGHPKSQWIYQMIDQLFQDVKQVDYVPLEAI
ncbi:pentatricopeptide repeat-containing protein At3g29230 [Tripterygium wilfordii]|uniref:pentatricopeptide repeat-containing protein At3g29230 n=1 Tax=Tripterygium wilfordii TaxID=458696 RepID=UPI0018F80C0A|nr:pentatricopeptide repeat-containing protein At3g29230 [Tripterygium wilfordii]